MINKMGNSLMILIQKFNYLIIKSTKKLLQRFAPYKEILTTMHLEIPGASKTCSCFNHVKATKCAVAFRIILSPD